jgi:hypothetical protein
MENTKIINALLKAKFPNTNVTALLEIISTTPNPELATEILCDLYEEPKVKCKSQIGIHTNTGYEEVLGKFLSYDKWSNTVEFEYKGYKKRSGYFSREIKNEDINESNFDELVLKTKTPDCKWVSITTSQEQICTSTINLKDWMKNQYNEIDENLDF